VQGAKIVETSVNATWLEVKKSTADDIAIITVSANLTPDEREATVSISVDGEVTPRTVSIAQEGSVFETDLSNLAIEFGGPGTNLPINVTNTAEVPYSVIIPDGDEWLSYAIEGGVLTLIVDPSNTLKRESTVSLISGERRIDISVAQIVSYTFETGNYILEYKNCYSLDGQLVYKDLDEFDSEIPIYSDYRRIVTLAAGWQEGTYVIKENLPVPEKIDSLVFTYDDTKQKLKILSGQLVGNGTVGANNRTYRTYVLNANDNVANGDNLSYEAPVGIQDGVFSNFTFSRDASSPSTNNIAITIGHTSPNGSSIYSRIAVFKDIKLYRDPGNIDEIKEELLPVVASELH
jgi:hypothetical protein